MKMNEQQQAELRQRMTDAASLAPNDPHRLAVVREVVAAGEWAEREWVDLIANDERIRMDLQRVNTPPTLAARLIQLPDEAPAELDGSVAPLSLDEDVADAGDPGMIDDRWRMHGGGAGWVRVAAVVLIAIGLWAGLSNVMSTKPSTGGASVSVDTRLQSLGLLAFNHHMLHHPMHIFADSRADLQSRVDARVPFKVHLPDLGEGCEGEGASICKLDGHDVVCTRWRDGKHIYTLFQYSTADFDLPTRIGRRTVSVARPWREGAGAATHEIEFWTRGDCAYALLTETDAAQPPPNRAN